MSLIDHIEQLYTETIVYWGNPTNDGFGAFTFDDPVEIKCRWENKEQIVSKADEKAVIFRSIIFVLQDVDTDGLIWRGSLDDLTDTQEADPRNISDIMIIKRFEKTPAIRAQNSYLRKAFLSPYMY